MQQSDMRIDALNDFPVKLQHQPQHAVRGGMLRSEIDAEGLIVSFGRRVAHFRGVSLPLSSCQAGM